MKVIDKITQNTSGRPLMSFEIIPPLRGTGIQGLYECIDPLIEFDPSFINVTYHREEYVFKERENGLLEKFTLKKRPGTVGICAAIMHKYEVDTVPHIICGGFSKEETENALIDLNFLGVDNVLLLRGDAANTEPSFRPHPRGHAHATDLIQQVVALNDGKYLDEDIENPLSTNFCIGVAGYPEKHFEAPNLDEDMRFLRMKVDLGAEYIVTQMFFDNSKYFAFVERCRRAGIGVPIIPGIKPLASVTQLRNFPHFFHIDIPQDLVQAVEACKNKEDVGRVGVEWAAEQCKELIKRGVNGIHFFTMSRAGPTAAILKEIF